jgi:hypothetical protein
MRSFFWESTVACGDERRLWLGIGVSLDGWYYEGLRGFTPSYVGKKSKILGRECCATGRLVR